MKNKLPVIDPNKMMTPPEIAPYLGVTARTAQRYARRKVFPNCEITPSGYKVPGQDVIDYLESKSK